MCMGAKVAAPQRTVLSLMGDGGFGMTMGEMATAVQHHIATIAVVMDNGAWGSEIAYQRDFYNQRYIGAQVLSPRFDEVMKLCGGHGYLATEPGDTAQAVHQAIQAGKPAVVHVKVDPDAVLSFRRDALQQRQYGTSLPAVALRRVLLCPPGDDMGTYARRRGGHHRALVGLAGAACAHMPCD